MTTVEQLKAVKELIGTPERWTKGALARTKDGADVGFYSDHACQWCLVGALLRVGFRKLGNRCNGGYVLRTELSKTLDHVPVHLNAFNDLPTTTHADIMALLDRAIEAEEKKGTA